MHVQRMEGSWDALEGVKGGGGWRGGEEMQQADCESEHTRLRVSPRGTAAGLFRGLYVDPYPTWLAPWHWALI